MLAHECARQLQWLRRTCSQGLPALRREPCSHVGHWWVRYGCHRCFGAHFRYHSCLQDTSKMTRVSLGTKQFQQVFWRMYRSMPEVSRVGHCVHATGALEHDADVIGVLGHRMGVTYVWKRCSSATIKYPGVPWLYISYVLAMYVLAGYWQGIGWVLLAAYWHRVEYVLEVYLMFIDCFLDMHYLCISWVLTEYWLIVVWILERYFHFTVHELADCQNWVLLAHYLSTGCELALC